MNYIRIYILTAVMAFAGASLFAIADMPNFGAAETVIEADQLEMETTDEANRFYFTGNVKVSGNNLVALCHKLIVTTSKGDGFGQAEETEEEAADEESPDGKLGEFGSIENVVAEGDVTIRQMGREATADKAVIHPNEEYVEMVGNVTIRTEDGTVSGDKFILEKGKRARMVSTNEGTSKSRPRVVLPGFDDMGPDAKPKKDLDDTEAPAALDESQEEEDALDRRKAKAKKKKKTEQDDE